MQELRSKLRDATADDHRRTEDSFAAVLDGLPDSYGDFLLAHAAAFPAVGRALSATFDWSPWIARWDGLKADLATLRLDLPQPLTLAAATSRSEALGMAYVLEGSRLGSTLLLQRIPGGLPAAYLGGGHDRAPWLALLAELETIAPQQEAAVIAGARIAFGAFRAAAEHLLPVPA